MTTDTRIAPIDTVEDALRARGWTYRRREANGVVTGVTSATGQRVFISVQDVAERATLLLLFLPLARGTAAEEPGTLVPVRIHADAGFGPDDVSRTCQRLLERNNELLIGSFDRDQRDGEIRFRIALPYRDAGLTGEQVSWCIDLGVRTLTDGLEGLAGPPLVYV